jgi:CHASE3 domain sensor protein
MDAHHEVTLGLRQIEGYLYREAHVREAHRKARDFAWELPGLTTDQRLDVEEAYARVQVENARQVTRHIAERIQQIEGQYEARHRRLARSMAAAMAVVTLGMVGLCIAVILGTAAGAA